MAYEEEEASKDAAIRKAIKDVGIEVETTEGRGILKVGFGMTRRAFESCIEGDLLWQGQEQADNQKPCPEKLPSQLLLPFNQCDTLFSCLDAL